VDDCLQRTEVDQKNRRENDPAIALKFLRQAWA
jgi:hypothetical protein